MPARAYEIDAHYYLTFAIALSSGWDWESARIIAAADQALDENKATVAALGISTLATGPIEQNFVFHCFSRADDADAVESLNRNDDVQENLNTLRKKAFDNLAVWDQLTPRHQTAALVTLGVFLHCQEDSWSHMGFGGEHDGHALETFFDSIAPRVFQPSVPQRHNPDHPALRELLTKRAVAEKFRILREGLLEASLDVANVNDSDKNVISGLVSNHRLLKLSNSGRQRCVQVLAEHWLYNIVKSQNRLSDVPDGSILAFQADNRTYLPWHESCSQVHNLHAFEHVEPFRISTPTPHYPRVSLYGEIIWESLRDDGSYIGTGTADFDLVTETIDVQEIRRTEDGCVYEARFLIGNTGQRTSPKFEVVVVIIGGGVQEGAQTTIFSRKGQKIVVARFSRPELGTGDDRFAESTERFEGQCVDEGVIALDIVPHQDFPLEKLFWSDANIHNDRLLVAYNKK